MSGLFFVLKSKSNDHEYNNTIPRSSKALQVPGWWLVEFLHCLYLLFLVE